MITYMTPSRIEFEFNGESYTVHGEALDPSFGMDYVIYADDFHFTDATKEAQPISVDVRRRVLDAIKIELSSKGTRFEVEGDDGAPVVEGPSSSGASRCEANQPCPAQGFWFTPAQAGSRKYFNAGEVMRSVGGDYGATIWQWDQNQAPPKLS